MKPIPFIALGCLLLVGCDLSPKSEAPANPIASKAAPVAAVVKPTADPLTPDQLTALAFRTAWGGPPPIEREEGTGNQTDTRTYRSGKLIALEGGRYALISDGQGGEGHVNSGSLSIHYLQRTGDSFTRIGSWPGFLVSGTWGAPPEWKIRTDLTPSPALVAEAGGTWQGYTCTWAHVIELTPDKPIVRIDQIPTSYSDGGAREEGETKSMEGVLIPGQKGKSMRVRYTGDVDATVVYAKVGESYDPVNLPELLTC
ncbi:MULTISPECIES: hypothetical protein [Brevundimonas]|uniref:Lipoprotein n=1 Tax=Brevundimonas fontaquae TaxID=2813778 RepID=A0ABX7LMN7_9CAUL|nr:MULTISPECIES: hypothetical protein [Brevundimonas]QIF81646.1 hypothetical protein E4341_07970 [Brevundimonas sp. 'scallop']QSF53414.1 hypothetical protein JX001_11500 [Brevundimonas fontaquae]